MNDETKRQREAATQDTTGAAMTDRVVEAVQLDGQELAAFKEAKRSHDERQGMVQPAQRPPAWLLEQMQSERFGSGQVANKDMAQFLLRLPESMRDALKAAGIQNSRSLNSEILARLKDSFELSRPDIEATIERMSDTSRLLMAIGDEATDLAMRWKMEAESQQARAEELQSRLDALSQPDRPTAK